MHDEEASQQQERLEAAVVVDPGVPGFSALAEYYRRAGRLADAEAVVRAGLEAKPDAWDGQVALALVLLDRGLELEARDTLGRLVEAGAALHGIPLPGRESPVVPSFDVDEQVPTEADPQPEPPDVSLGAPFATGTMADLLERQGDFEGAERIRATLLAPPQPEDDEVGIVEELTRWLANAKQRMEERV